MFLKYLAYLWNPFKRSWKPRTRNGKPILDVWQRRKEKLFTQKILTERKREGQGPNRHYKVGLRSKLDLHGKTK